MRICRHAGVETGDREVQLTNSLSVRATSLAASSAMLGALLIAALSFSFAINHVTTHDPSGVTLVREPEPPPAPTPPMQPREPLAPPDIINPLAPIPFEPLTPLAANDIGGIPAVAQSGPINIENPRWLQRPSGLDRYYPRRAREAGTEGAAQLDCLVTPVGALECRVISESPVGWGFGAAALRMSRDYRMAPATRDGAATEGRYRMRIPFQLN